MSVTAAGRVVVGVDASIGGLQALRFAVAQARHSARPLQAVRAWTITTSWRDPAAVTERWRREFAREAYRYVTSAFATALGSIPSDVPIHVIIRQGPPGPALAEYATSEGDLLVLGGRSARFGRSTSPITRYCLARASAPVVVVPAPGWARAATIRRVAHEVERDLERLSRRPLS